MYFKTTIACMLLFLMSCKNSDSKAQVEKTGKAFNANMVDNTTDSNKNPYPDIASVPVPAGFKRFDT
ncbi:MAG: hypothetical protein ABIT58_08535, partial [Ferruginibacter sp.]